MKIGLKVIPNDNAPLCRGCFFDGGKKCTKTLLGIDQSCHVKTNKGIHMGIFVRSVRR